ncbi:hypothetical protein MMC12_001246 [Toensbergia leucococca]|nr:hypothetical protein [Toensbergia leucococca]
MNYPRLEDYVNDRWGGNGYLEGQSEHLLTAVAYVGDVSLLKKLLNQGTSIHDKSEYFGTPLQVAASRGHYDIVLLLLEEGADANYGEGPRAIDREREAKYIDLLYHLGTPLQAASAAGHENIVKLLLMSEYKVTTSTLIFEKAIYQAASHGHLHLTQFLMEKATITPSSDVWKLVLLEACQHGHEEIARMMLDKGISANTEDGPWRYLLSIAASQGRHGIVKLLLSRGADRDDWRYNQALFLAAKHGFQHVAQTLLDDGAYVNGFRGTRDGLFITSICGAAGDGQAHMIDFFLDRGADLSEGGVGETALRAAGGGGFESVVRILLERGADVHWTDERSNPMINALRDGYDGVVDLLLEFGAERIDPLQSVYAADFASGKYPDRLSSKI